jgi:predicted SAM-dependent methyltransferase
LIKLNLGCGLDTPETWINIDGSWNAWFAKFPVIKRVLNVLHLLPKKQADIPWSKDILVHDVRKGLPFSNNSVDVVYSSHLFEHLYHDDAKKLLMECMRVLRPEGVLRIVVPDFRAMILTYINEYQTNDFNRLEKISPAHKLQESLLLRTSRSPSGSMPYKLYTALNDFHSHKWMYDTDSLQKCFWDAGFVQIQEMPCHESRILDIDVVENPGRILDGAGFCVEGIKPKS